MTIIQRVAQANGISEAECRAEMAAAIREAWDTEDPFVKQLQIELVGESCVPSPEELIVLLCSKLTAQ